jgi:hypothetical protein
MIMWRRDSAWLLLFVLLPLLAVLMAIVIPMVARRWLP